MRNLFIFLCSYFFICSPTLSAQTWTTLDAPEGGRYDDVFFVNPALGWACNANGEIFHTVNSGANWVVQTSLASYLRSIEFISPDTGFCGGLMSGSYFFKTTDGGQNWQNITAEVPGLTGGICGLSCPGNGRVYGCGVWSTPAYIIKSDDSGQSWEKIDMSAYATALVDIFFITPDSGWVSGTAQPATEGGIILSTSDGGLTWNTKIKTGFHDDYVWKLQTPDSTHFFASIERLEIAGATTQILKSSDGGATWVKKKVATASHHLQMIGFLNAMHGFTGDANLFESTDGGETWGQVPAGQLGNLNRFWRVNPETAIVSGHKLFRYSSGSTGIQETKSEGSAKEPRLFVTPNPSSGPLHIRVELGARTNVILKTIPVDGKSTELLLWKGEHPAGTYEFDSQLPGNWATQPVLVWLKTDFGAVQQTVTLVR